MDNENRFNTSENDDTSNMDATPIPINNTESHAKNEIPKDTYNYKDSGPFLVLMQENNQHLTKLHPIKMGKKLFENNIGNIIQIKKSGNNKFEIYFQSYDDANKFINSKSNEQNDTYSFIPRYHIYSKGIVKNIDIDMSNEEIIEQSKTPEQYKFVHVKRFHRRTIKDDNIELIPTTKVAITFETQIMDGIKYAIDRSNYIDQLVKLLLTEKCQTILD